VGVKPLHNPIRCYVSSYSLLTPILTFPLYERGKGSYVFSTASGENYSIRMRDKNVPPIVLGLAFLPVHPDPVQGRRVKVCTLLFFRGRDAKFCVYIPDMIRVRCLIIVISEV
jgi:hypothetical protein